LEKERSYKNWKELEIQAYYRRAWHEVVAGLCPHGSHEQIKKEKDNILFVANIGLTFE
jgi:hypothetical protein